MRIYRRPGGRTTNGLSVDCIAFNFIVAATVADFKGHVYVHDDATPVGELVNTAVATEPAVSRLLPRDRGQRRE